MTEERVGHESSWMGWRNLDGSEGRVGYELPWIYDGISCWKNPDGTWTNRWREQYPPQEMADGDPMIERRMEATDRWIAEQEASGDE